jgi:hypothetical protein
MLRLRRITSSAWTLTLALSLVSVILVVGPAAGSALGPPSVRAPAARQYESGDLGRSNAVTTVGTSQTITFVEAGLPKGTLWSVILGEHSKSSSATKIKFTESAGSYYWGTFTGSAQVVRPTPAGVVTVSKSPATVSLSFLPSSSTHPIQHVVVIVLENEGSAAVARWGTYENYVAQRYGSAEDYYASCHHSAPNYLSMVAAVTNQCSNSAGVSDSFHTYDNTSLGDLLVNGGLSWGQFVESLPSTFTCSNPGASAGNGLFALQHVPFAFFKNSTTRPPSAYGPNYCSKHILSSNVFNGSAAGGLDSTSFVNFSFYTPNLCDNGHNVCTTSPGCPVGNTTCYEVRQADKWLQGFLGPLLNGTGRYAHTPIVARNVAHTTFLIAYDESGNPLSYNGYAVRGDLRGNAHQYCLSSSNPASKGDAVCGGLVPLLVVSPDGPLREKMTAPAAPYSIAATVEWLFGLKGANGSGLDNPGHFDSFYRWVDPGFPTFEWLLGISGDGYSARN